MMVYVCYLRLHYDIHSASCHFFLWIPRIEMAGTRQVWANNFQVFILSQQKNTKIYIMGCAFLKHFIRYSPNSLSGTFRA